MVKEYLAKLMPVGDEIPRFLISSIGLHYVGKVSELAGKIPIINMLPEAWRGVALGWLIYKWGDAVHEYLRTFGAIVTIANLEKAIAGFLPGSESVIKPPSGGLTPEEYLKQKYGLR
jgi:hypothetical protein